MVKPPHSCRLAFQNKKLVEESNIVFALFLGVFVFIFIPRNFETYSFAKNEKKNVCHLEDPEK